MILNFQQTFFECSSIERRQKWKSEAEHALSYLPHDFCCFEKFQTEIILEFNLPLATKQLIE